MMPGYAGMIAAEAAAVGFVHVLVVYLMYSSVLLGGAWLLSLACHARADVRDLVWKAAIVLTLIVTGVELIGADGRADRAGSPSVVHGVLPDVVSTAGDKVTGAAKTGSVFRPGATLERLRSASVHLTLDRGWVFTIVFAWMVGAFVGLCRQVMARRRLTNFIRVHGVSGGPGLEPLVGRLRNRMGCRKRIRVVSVPGGGSPFAMGRSTVVVPRAFWAELNVPQREAILAHEVAHIARGDVLWRNVLGMIGIVCFFQPLHRVARRSITECAELLSDQAAIDCTERRAPLAQSLLALAEHLGRGTAPERTGAVSASGASIVERVIRITAAPSLVTPRRYRIAAVAAVALAAGLVWSSTPAVRADLGSEAESQDAAQNGSRVSAFSGAAPSVSRLPREIDPAEWNTYLQHTHVANHDTVYTEFAAMGLHEWRGFDPERGMTSPSHLLLESRSTTEVRRVEIIPSDRGDQVVLYEVNGIPSPYDQSAKRWLADRLADLQT